MKRDSLFCAKSPLAEYFFVLVKKNLSDIIYKASDFETCNKTKQTAFLKFIHKFYRRSATTNIIEQRDKERKFHD